MDSQDDIDLQRKLDTAASALSDLCGDFGELDRLAYLLRTFPSSYGLPARLAQRLYLVGSRLWDVHDDAAK